MYGYQGPIDTSGQPTTTYAIDGVVAGSYTAPVIAPGSSLLSALFFQSPDLPNMAHTLVITMINGTQPNTYYLRYLDLTGSLLASSPSLATPSGASSGTAQPSVAPIPLQPSSSIPTPSRASIATAQSNTPSSRATQSATSKDISQSSSGSATPPPSQSTSVSNASSSPTRVGPIIGGVLGGIIFLIAFASFLYICLKKRESKLDHPSSQIEQIPGELSWSYPAI